MYSALASGAGSVVTGTLTNMFTTDGNKYTLNSNVFQTENIQSFANLAGALTTDGINYAMTGSMTLNVLNASTIAKWLKIEQNTPSSDENKSLFGQRPVSGGLVELTLGEGAGLRIGSGGTGISLSMLASALAGLGEAAKVGSWKYGGIEKKTTLNGINAQSYSKIDTDLAFAQDVWSGEKIITYGDIGDDKGRYNSKDGTITMSRTLLGGGRESAAEWAAVASHENAHARGFLEEKDAHMSGLSTYLGVTGNLGITADEKLVTEMLFGAIMNDNSANEDGVYHWALTMKEDGTYGWREDGMYINIDGTRTDTPKEGETLGAAGIETGLLNIIAGTSGNGWNTFSEEEVQSAQELMRASGMKPDDPNATPEAMYWTNSENNGVKLDMNAFFELAGEDVASVLFDRYYNNLADLELADAFGVDLMFSSSDINKIVPDSLQDRFTELVGTHLAETPTPATLVDKYLFTFNKKDDTVVPFLRPDENNPFLDQLLGQHDITSVPAIDSSGCNAMTQLALVQLITGTVFNESTIASIWNEAAKNGFVDNSDSEFEGMVWAPTELSELAFSKTKEMYTSFRLDINIENKELSEWITRNNEQRYFGQIISARIGVPYNNPNEVGHFVLGSPNNILFNPGYSVGDHLNVADFLLYEAF